MSQNQIQKTMNQKFMLFTKLSIAFGVVLMLVVATWFTLLALALLGNEVSIFRYEWLKYIYYAIFFFASLMVPAWIATSAGSAINSLSIIQINTRKYRVEALVTSIITIVFIAIGAIVVLMGYIPGVEDPSKVKWPMVGIGTILLIIALIAIIIGVVCNIIALSKAKKK